MSVQEETGAPEYNLKHVVGDTFIRNIVVRDLVTQAVKDITGWTIFFTAKQLETDGDGSAKVTATVTSHIDAANGRSRIVISASDMAAFGPGEYPYDIQVKKDDGTIQTILRGILIMQAQRTVRTS